MQFLFQSDIMRASNHLKIITNHRLLWGIYRRRNMAVIKDLIQVESNGTISFGDYTLDAKAKLDNFEVGGAFYKVKTYKDITKLECNDVFVYESVPGTAVFGFGKNDTNVTFKVEGTEGAQITLGLEPETEYEIVINGESVGAMTTNLGGKLSFSVELEQDASASVSVSKK